MNHTETHRHHFRFRNRAYSTHKAHTQIPCPAHRKIRILIVSYIFGGCFFPWPFFGNCLSLHSIECDAWAVSFVSVCIYIHFAFIPAHIILIIIPNSLKQSFCFEYHENSGAFSHHHSGTKQQALTPATKANPRSEIEKKNKSYTQTHTVNSKHRPMEWSRMPFPCDWNFWNVSAVSVLIRVPNNTNGHPLDTIKCVWICEFMLFTQQQIDHVGWIVFALMRFRSLCLSLIQLP